MALVKFGGGVVQMSGSIAGTVFARNRFGNYTRPRTKPVNPRSPRQTAARVIMQYLAEAWRESPMTDNIRAAWQVYADSVNWNNRLGEQVTLTGFNMFMMGNACLQDVGAALVTTAPVVLGLPAGDPNFLVSNLSEATQDFDYAFDDGFDWCSEDDAYLIIHQGKPVAPSHNFFGGPWRRSSYLEGSVGVPVTSPMVGVNQHGWPYIETQKIWWKARIVRADGRVTTPFYPAPTIVGA